jgi:excisionase family DNA binding protein
MKQSLAVLPRPAFKKREAARILNVSEVTLDKIIRDEGLRAFRPTPTSVRILPDDLQEFINAHATR